MWKGEEIDEFTISSTSPGDPYLEVTVTFSVDGGRQAEKKRESELLKELPLRKSDDDLRRPAEEPPH
jgi:hypothetical protein